MYSYIYLCFQLLKNWSPSVIQVVFNKKYNRDTGPCIYNNNDGALSSIMYSYIYLCFQLLKNWSPSVIQVVFNKKYNRDTGPCIYNNNDGALSSIMYSCIYLCFQPLIDRSPSVIQGIRNYKILTLFSRIVVLTSLISALVKTNPILPLMWGSNLKKWYMKL